MEINSKSFHHFLNIFSLHAYRKSNQDMSDADREKRRRAQTEKKKKLANPLYFVSPTRYVRIIGINHHCRICIRNLKKSLNNSDVYNLCIKAAAAGIRNGLVTESDNETYLAAQCVPIRERTKDKLAVPPALDGKDATGKKVVLSAKIMLDNAKLRFNTFLYLNQIMIGDPMRNHSHVDMALSNFPIIVMHLLVFEN